MQNNEKITRILADNYFQAASSECDMFRITEILEEVRKMDVTPKDFQKVEDRLEVHMGENLEHENEFGIVQQLLEQLRELKNANYKTEILDALKKDEKKGWSEWLGIFGFELSKTNFDTLNFLLEMKIPGKQNQDYRMIKKLTPYLKEERWPESLPLFEYFISLKSTPNPVKADLHLLAAQVQLYHFWDFEKSLEHAKEVKKLLPDSPKAERILGEYYIQKKDFESARRHLQKALDLDKRDFENYLVLGNLYKAENRYETAESWYNEGMKENPGKADLYNRLLLLNEHAEYYEKHNSTSDLLVEKIIKLDTTFTFTALNNAGFVHQKNGNFDKAEEYYEKAIEIYPERTQGYTNLAYSYLDKKDLEKTEEAFRKAIVIDKDSFDAYWGLVALNRIKADWNEVIANLKFCEKYRPSWRMYIYNDYGNAYEKLGDLENAQKYYLLALKNDPEGSLGLSVLLDIAELDLSLEKGIELLKSISEIKGPDFDNVFNYRTGIIYYKNQLYDEAVKSFEKAASLIQGDPVKLEYMGLAFEKSGSAKNAEAAYRKAIDAATGNKSKYLNRLAFFLTNLNRCEEAIEWLNKAIELKPEPLYYENRGYAHELLGHADDAIKNYNQALEIAINDKDIYENRLGIFYYNRRNYNKAIEHYGNAISLQPKSVYYENIGLAYENSGDLANAEESYKKAIELETFNKGKYYNRLGFFLSNLGKHKEAIELLQQAIEIKEVPTYYENLGFSLEKLGQLEEAEKNYRKALEHSPNEKDIYLNRLGVFYFNKKKYGEAISYYKQAIEVLPKAVYFENLGNAYLDSYSFGEPKNLEDFKSFERAFLKAAKYAPNDGRYFFQLGWRILIELKDTKKSKKYLNKALEIFRETPEIEPEELLSIQYLGAAFQQEGNLDKAEEIFMEAYNLDPNNDLVCNFLGKVYLDKKDVQKSLEFYSKALQIDPTKMSNIKNVADVLEMIGETDKVIDIYLNGAKEEPALYESIGKIYFRKEDFVNAEKYFRLALDAYPENYLYLENLGLGLQKLQKYNEAITEFLKALDLAPPEEKSFFNNYIGNCWYALNEMQKAAEYYQIAFSQDPKSKVYSDNLILALKGAGKKEEAKKFIEKQLKKDPENTNLINQIGLLHFNDKEYEKAIVYFEKNTVLNAGSYIPFDNLGLSYEKLNQPEKAIEAYKKGLHLDKSFYEKIGKIYFNIKDYDTAEVYIRKAQEADPENDMYINNLGIVLAFQNKTDEAIETYIEAIKKSPENPVFHESLSRIKESQGKMDEAIEYMRQATEKESKIKDKYFFELGKLYEKTGDNEKAKSNIEMALSMYSEISYFDELGKLYFNDGEYEKSTELFKKALKAFPNDAQFKKNYELSVNKVIEKFAGNKQQDDQLENGLDKTGLASFSEN